MVAQKIQTWFFILFTLIVLVLTFFVFLPYVSILFLALVFAIIFYPFHERILRIFSNRKTIASITSVFIVFLLISGPVSFFTTLLFQEASDMYRTVVNADNGNSMLGISMFEKKINDLFPGFFPNAEVDTIQYVKQGLSWILDNLSVFFGGFLKIAIGLFLMLLALFYFLRDGKHFVDTLVEISPLPDDSDKKIITKIVVAVNSVVRGHLVIGLAQGFLTGVGFALFGMPSPVLWGSVAAVASLAPTVGTSLVILPAVLYLFFTGHVLASVGLLAWGVIAVGLVDNLLGPILIERGIKIHPFLILLSALGGLSFFGPVGFLAGPVLLALLFALLDIYPGVVNTR
jgi:predicted PurR-regulated permease PerM